LLDRVTTVQQLALVTVDIGDLGLAAGRRQEAGIISEEAGFAAKATDIDHIVAVSARHDRKLGGLAVDGQ
jgi:hypothetical protein